MPNFKNSNAEFWVIFGPFLVIFAHCAEAALQLKSTNDCNNHFTSCTTWFRPASQIDTRFRLSIIVTWPFHLALQQSTQSSVAAGQTNLAKKIPKMNFLGYLFFPHDQAFCKVNLLSDLYFTWLDCTQKCPKYLYFLKAELYTAVENSQKKSHSALRAKRATFTFWMDKISSKMPKIVNF